eukprot:gnl/Hemi2/9820_TR3411_c0_g1_i1.p1 gnl/Hemi2/9820_TR3411_c0_g1~~gnl/Hemi2/9820_TR3411_c0_g1_i1.p1  ORF type:complete len:186 (+),score=30.50 gnl/Hemi2/9820_TR3411_c0_g1_i1:84-641(+)
MDNTGSAPETDIYCGKKERRKSSSFKVFVGDYKNLSQHKSFSKVTKKWGDRVVHFSDEVMKVNRRNKMQKRILLITENALYNMLPDSLKIQRRIDLTKINGVSLSQLSDNFFTVHVLGEYDYLLVSGKKTEIVTTLCDIFTRMRGMTLPIQVSNSFDFRVNEVKVREIMFTKVTGGVNTQIFTKK